VAAQELLERDGERLHRFDPDAPLTDLDSRMLRAFAAYDQARTGTIGTPRPGGCCACSATGPSSPRTATARLGRPCPLRKAGQP
jgi:hypothetical protein